MTSSNLYLNTDVLYSLKLIPWDIIRQYSAGNLMGYYEGQTKETTHKDVLKALCWVFFLNEAYALIKRGKQGYGAESLDQLMELTDNEDYPVMIFAGYNCDMEDFI